MKNTDQCAVTDIKRVTRIAAVFFVIAATTYKRFRNNLTQELAGADEDFRKHLDRIADDWRTGIRAAFERGQEAGNVRKDVNTAAVASLVFATYQGSHRFGEDLARSGCGHGRTFDFLGPFGRTETVGRSPRSSLRGFLVALNIPTTRLLRR